VLEWMRKQLVYDPVERQAGDHDQTAEDGVIGKHIEDSHDWKMLQKKLDIGEVEIMYEGEGERERFKGPSYQ
jgi:hypothetical protein